MWVRVSIQKSELSEMVVHCMISTGRLKQERITVLAEEASELKAMLVRR